jgi:hypothetical protein
LRDDERHLAVGRGVAAYTNNTEPISFDMTSLKTNTAKAWQ